MTQIFAHLIGDYILQSDWMAMNKSKRTWPCLVHVLLYTSCFLFLTTSWKALLVIGGVHFILDRWPVIIRRLIWLKNHINPNFKYVPFEKCRVTGYFDTILMESNADIAFVDKSETVNGFQPRLNYITIWLYIITDNLLHLLTNYLALTYLT
jgi:uncharacterized protein DUF3307